jgi:universal stress protein A
VLEFRKILVPVDFSPSSVKAYAYAAGISKVTRAALLALHAIPPIHYVEAADSIALTHEAQAAAEKALRKLRPRPTESIIERGVPHDVIIKVARATGADMIVMGTHGHSGLRRLLLGSVAENVVRHAACPVLTVRSKT